METPANSKFLMAAFVVLTTCGAGIRSGEAASWFNLQANEDNPAPLNRFRVGYHAGFNVTAKFKNIAGVSSANNPGPDAPVANHNYDDGYNRVDSTGNNHVIEPGTWNWGYENASQVQGSTIFMHSSSSAAGSTAQRDGDPQMGVELSYSRQFGRIGRFSWGVQGAFSYTDLSISDSEPLDRAVTLITDAYDTTGVTPPQPPYHGSFEGPGPIIGDDPTRTISPATARGIRKIGANVYAFRMGPYFETPLSKRFAVSLSGGLSLAAIQSDFRFQETVVPTVGATALRSGKDSKDDLLAGAYAAATVSCTINKSWSAYAALQYQYLGRYSQTLSDKEATVDLAKNINLTVGVGFSF